MPIYVYECGTCGVTWEVRQGFDAHNTMSCPECNGLANRVIQPVPHHWSDSPPGELVRSESGQLARRVSEFDVRHFDKNTRIDSKGRPHMTTLQDNLELSNR